jgi:hypothetical protein
MIAQIIAISISTAYSAPKKKAIARPVGSPLAFGDLSVLLLRSAG